MAIHQFSVSNDRKRLVIKKSEAEPGIVMVQLRDGEGFPLATFSIDAPTAAVIAQAFEIEAVAAENAELVELAGRRCGCGAEFQKCGMSRCAGREIKEAKKTVSKIGPALVQAYADNNGRRPLQDLQVVDVARVGA